MKPKIYGAAVVSFMLVAVGVWILAPTLSADEFTKADTDRWTEEFMTVVNQGRELWVSGELGKNGVACAQCHPNAADTHPETYPKFQQQLGRVIGFRDMINWCLQQPLEGETLDVNGPKMIAMEAYATYERRGVALAPGKH
jgi:thiosulfate dehydrogenase